MSAHCKHCQQQISFLGARKQTHVVEAAAGVTIGNDLNSSIHASSNVQTSRELQSTSTDTEVLGSLFLDGRQQNVVEGTARVVSKSQ